MRDAWKPNHQLRCGWVVHLYVDRVFETVSGRYYYNLYVWSDSYYVNCSVSNTYIEDVNVLIFDGIKYTKIFVVPYLLAKPKSDYFNGWNFVGYVYSGNSDANIKLTWGNLNLY